MSQIRWEEYCPGCFHHKGSAAQCTYCGYDEQQRRSPLVLPHRTLLKGGDYVLGRVLGKPGGFGITYLAWDVNLDQLIAIKEFLPSDVAARDVDLTIVPHTGSDHELFDYGLQLFVQEARILAKFRHPNVVLVHSFFQENSTAYFVMDYYEGCNLEEYVDRHGGTLGERAAVEIMSSVLTGLAHVHSHEIYHRDLKPANIYLPQGGAPILLDFGAARHAVAVKSQRIDTIFTPGYAPIEQYQGEGIGPATDVYACAATLYQIVTGHKPPEANSRLSQDALQAPEVLAPGISQRLNQAILHGLAVQAQQRPQSAQEFLSLIQGPGWSEAAASRGAAPQPETSAVPAGQASGPPTAQGRRGWFAVSAVLIVLLLASGGYAAWRAVWGGPQPSSNGPSKEGTINEGEGEAVEDLASGVEERGDSNGAKGENASLEQDKPRPSYRDDLSPQLVKAVVENDLGSVRTLLGQNADPNARDQQRTPVLIIAARNDFWEIVDELRLADADLNAEIDGMTALLSAVALDARESARILVRHGANIKTRAGISAEDVAISRGNDEMVRILRPR